MSVIAVRVRVIHDPVTTNVEFDECPGYGVYAALSGSPMRASAWVANSRLCGTHHCEL